MEHIRPDIRVINFSLLGIDWYINQLRYKVNNSDPIDLIWTPDKYEGAKRNVVYYDNRQNIPQNQYFYLDQILSSVIGSDDPKYTFSAGNDIYNTFPVKKFSLAVDSNLVRQNGTVNPGDSIVKEVRFELSPNKNT